MDYAKMSKSQLLKKYGPFIKENYGKEEFDYVKREDVAGVRKYIIDLDPEPVKKYAGGLIAKNYANPVKVVDNRKKKK